jgi:uncharacterized spore protein YtfJ
VSETKRNAFETHLESLDELNDFSKRLFEAAHPQSVFGEPIEKGEYTVVPAAEVVSAGGVGYGFASGAGGRKARASETERSEAEIDSDRAGGGGGGAGGTSRGRPVAAINIGPEGVWVQPIVDVTKLGLAALTTLGSMGLMFLRMKNKK